MFTDKTIEQAWSLYQASLKHSTAKKDHDKFIEEFEEWCEANRWNRGLSEETTDLIIMILRLVMRTEQPKSIDALRNFNQNLAEHMEHKTERTLTRFKDGFYK